MTAARSQLVDVNVTRYYHCIFRCVRRPVAVLRAAAPQGRWKKMRDPHSPYAGKFVGIANGQVVAVADSWREISRRLREVESDPGKCCCIEASADYDAVHEVWSVL